MKYDKIYSVVESLINGNITEVKNDLKRMDKRDILIFVRIYIEHTHKPFDICIERIKDLLD